MAPAHPSVLLAEMTWPQVAADIARGRTTVVVPFGAVEQHGPHLVLDTDAVLGDRLAPMLARRLGAVCTPTVRVGSSRHHLAFAGTLSLRPETLTMVALDLIDSLARHGFRRIVLLPTHAGNDEPLLHAARRSPHDGVTIVVPRLAAVVEHLLSAAAARGTPVSDAGGHAGELETSLMLALAPHLVAAEEITPGYAGPLDAAATARFFDQGVHALSQNGVLGDPTGATAEAGSAHVVEFLSACEQAVADQTTPNG